MATPFLGQIDIFSFNFAPKGYALCNGQLLPINQNQALFSLLGTTYGGDGRVTFGLPNLQGRVPISMGAGHTLGEVGGSETVTINSSSMPAHNHLLQGNNTQGTSNTPANGSVLSQSVGTNNTGQPYNVSIYGSQAPTGAMYSGTIGNLGGSQPHNNMMPYLVLSMGIALQGIYPSRN
jgi:microcystin-dependent protein